jgi:hypothetical protein
MSLTTNPVQCCRCRHLCDLSQWIEKPRGQGISEKVCPRCGCKSQYDLRPQVAWCWASGLIEIGDEMPADTAFGSGAIEIARGPKCALKPALEVKARHGHEIGVLLVPGVPEAETKKEAGDALAAWLDWCAKSNGKEHSNGVVFSKGTKP